MKIVTDKTKIQELLTRGVSETIETNNLKKRLTSGQKLKIKFGTDPTSPHIHLGRMVPILKLRDLQEMGHEIHFIVGDFTGTIGDTSDKESERPMLDEKEVKKNMKTYFNQAGKILDLKKTKTHYNSKWLNKLNYKDIAEHANYFSVSDFISRENIKKRLDKGKRVSLREVLYPLMQGYDSVYLKSDVEIGGTDQRFNLLAGRTLQEAYRQEPQDVIITNLAIMGTDGRKMSSSWGNAINISDEPEDMYGKIMRINDADIFPYFIHTTRVSMSRIKRLEKDLHEKKTNPRDIKMELAWEITSLIHGEKKADAAQNKFVKTFQNKEVPKNVIEVHAGSIDVLAQELVKKNIVKSKNEFRRLLKNKAIKDTENEKVISESTKLKKPMTLKIGKRRFVKII